MRVEALVKSINFFSQSYVISTHRCLTFIISVQCRVQPLHYLPARHKVFLIHIDSVLIILVLLLRHLLLQGLSVRFLLGDVALLLQSQVQSVFSLAESR